MSPADKDNGSKVVFIAERRDPRLSQDAESRQLVDMAASLQSFVSVLSARGYVLTAHLVDVAALDLKCRISGVADHEMVTMGLMARHVFEQKWASRLAPDNSGDKEE